MIRDIRYLENTHLPDAEVVDHDETLDRLREFVTPSGDTTRICGTLGVVGPPGSGKTTVVTHALREFAPDGARIAHINCWRRRSRRDILHGVAAKLLPETDDVTDIETLPEPTGAPRYVVLDEADQLPDTDVLYDLAEAANLQTHLIAESLVDVDGRLDDRTRSRIRSGELIEFDAYSTEELACILRQRADHGLVDDAISDAELVRIASEAEGDARVAIDTLREAALRASSADASRIRPGHVAAALPVATPRERAGGRASGDTTRTQRGTTDAPPVGDLSPDCAVLSRLVADAGEITPGELYDRYRETADDPHSERWVRELLTQLQEYGVLERHGHGPATRWQVAEGGPRPYRDE